MYHVDRVKMTINIGCPVSNSTKKNFNISVTARPNRLIFFPRIEAYSHSKSMRTKLVRSFVQYHYWPQWENFTISQLGKKTMHLTKLLTNLACMYLECGHTSILGKKISWFALAVMEIVNLLFNKVPFALSCILFFPNYEIVKFSCSSQ